MTDKLRWYIGLPKAKGGRCSIVDSAGHIIALEVERNAAREMCSAHNRTISRSEDDVKALRSEASKAGWAIRKRKYGKSGRP